MAISYDSFISYINGLHSDGTMSDEDYNKIILYILSNGNPENSPRDLIQIRRGNVANLPELAQGELAFTIDEENMYIGGLNGNVKMPLAEAAKQMKELAIIYPSGDATKDVETIQNAVNTARNIRFATNGTVNWKMNAVVTIAPIETDFGLRGRTIDFNNCVIESTEITPGVWADNLFLFTSNNWPANLRSTIVKNGKFRYTVNNAFIKVQAGAMWNCTFENLGSFTGAYATSLIEFNSHLSGSNGGLNTCKNIDGASTHVKYAIRFTKEAGADGQFDDFIFERITSNYGDGVDGATIKLEAGVQIVYSNFKIIYHGGTCAYVIAGGANSYLQDCIIHNMYAEFAGATGIGIGVQMLRCEVKNMHLKYDPAITTFARCIYANADTCKLACFKQTNNIGTEQVVPYVETFTGDNNVFERIGSGQASTYVKIDNATFKNKIVNHYGDPFIYANGGVILNKAGGAFPNELLMNIPQSDVLNNAILRFKLRGNCIASASNRFAIKLIGSGVDITLLTYTSNLASNYEVNFDIVYFDGVHSMIYGTSSVDGVVQVGLHRGTPDVSQITIPNDLQLVCDITNSGRIYLTELDCMRIPFVNKPI